MPVEDGVPVYEQEEILLETDTLHHYKIPRKKEVQSYSESLKKEDKAIYRKGRFAVGAKIPQSERKASNKVILEPNVQLTDEFSLLFNQKVSPKILDTSLDGIGVKYSPKKLDGTSFGITGSGNQDRQKLKFNTDFYLW